MGRVVNILLIEDSEDDALFFQMGLQTSGANMIHVPDAGEAIFHLERKPLPDLIVMDLGLPGVSVNTFLDWIQSNPAAQSIPIVIHTGAGTVPEDVKAAVRQIFFKSPDLIQNRQTVLEIVRIADPSEPKTGL